MNTLPIVLPAEPLVGCIPFVGAAPPGEETGLFAGALTEAIARLVAQLNEPDGESALAAFLTGERLPAVPVTAEESNGVPQSTDTSSPPEDAVEGNSPAAEKPGGEERLNWAGLAALLALSQMASPGRLPVAPATGHEHTVNGEKAEQPRDAVARAVLAVGKPLGETTGLGGDGVRPLLVVKHDPLAFTATQAYAVPRPVSATLAEDMPAEGVGIGSGREEQTVAPMTAVSVAQPAHSSKPMDGAAGGGRNESAPEVGQANMSPPPSVTGQPSPQVKPDRAEADAPAVRFVSVNQPHRAPGQEDVGQNADGQADVVTQVPAEAKSPVPTGPKPPGAQMQRRAELWVRFSEPSGMPHPGIAPKPERRQSATPAEPDNLWRPEAAAENIAWPFRRTWEQFGRVAYASEKPMPAPELTEASPGAMRVVLPQVAEAYPLMATEEATPQGPPPRHAAAQGASPARQGTQPHWPAGHETASIANATSAAVSTATPEASEGLLSTSVGIRPVADRSWLRATSWAGEKDVIPAAVSRYLVERLTQAVRRGEQQCRLELYPKELGRVDAHLSFTEERLSVYLGVETAQAHRAVQQSLPELRFALEARGVPVAQCHVELLGGGTTFGQGFDQPRDQAGASYIVPLYRDDAGDGPSQQARAITPVKPQGLVDLMV
jgi:hypothetical protein